MRHVRGTGKYMLTYKKSDHLELIGCLDSDFAGCFDTRKSTLGYIFLLSSVVISWRGAKQTLVTPSTFDVEFDAGVT